MEIKKDLIKVEEGNEWLASANNYVITEEHSLSDVIRFAVSQCDYEEIKYIVDNLDEEDQKLCAPNLKRTTY